MARKFARFKSYCNYVAVDEALHHKKKVRLRVGQKRLR
jgi:hypothetical protein